MASALRGPAVADVAAHFALALAGGDRRARWPSACAAASRRAESRRRSCHRPERIYRGVPRRSFRILEAYLRALRSARRFIYLENQFLWSPEIVAALRDKLLHPPTADFRLRRAAARREPNSGDDDTPGQLGELARGRRPRRRRFLACTLYARSDGSSPPVYVHAKVGIVDDRWLTVGSANLNDHSLFNDTEVNVVTHDARLARETRLRLCGRSTSRRRRTSCRRPGRGDRRALEADRRRAAGTP